MMMNRLSRASGLLVFATLLLLTGCLGSSETVTVTQRPEPIPSTEEDTVRQAEEPVVAMPAGFDTVRAQRFDQGKMWTFENPPLTYFENRYGFEPDTAWFNKARLGALRFGGNCSASFVSPNGLIMTNHHCGRESISEVSRPGEELLDTGFYAQNVEAERRVPELYVEQLVAIDDVTQRVYEAEEQRTVQSGDATAQFRQQQVQRLQEQLTQQAKQRDERLRVEVTGLYSGSRYSAYTFRRYEDVRLVMAPELQLGFYGGSPDNFTYPRYNLDVAFFRAYNDEGQPLQTNNYFSWDTSGAEEGDAVFVIGNPGSTSRLNTVSQLEFEREFTLPSQHEALQHRADILQSYVRSQPDSASAYELRNLYFSIENSIKSTRGHLRGLHDPYLIARRAAAERTLQREIMATDSLRSAYGDVINQIDLLQQSKEPTARKSAAFSFFTSSQLGSRILTRGVYGYYYALLRQRGAPADQLADIQEDALDIEDWPAAVEEAFIAARLREMRDALGSSDPTVRRVLQDRTPEAVAQRLVTRSALTDSSLYATILEDGYLGSKDASVPVIQAMAPLYFTVTRQLQDYQSSEDNLNARLARARFSVFKYTIPPDATFTPRIADGVVQGYEYNGTRAAAFTNFYGLLDHYHSYQVPDWDLPERWQNLPDGFDPSTPLNLVTTNDISGGNSGSPLLNQDLEIVGLIFDSNYEALPNEYLYTNRAARAVSVDGRGILEALEHVYNADRVAVELTSGRLIPGQATSEVGADAGTR